MSLVSPNDSQAKHNVAVLVVAQAILGGQMPIMFIVGGLAGGMLTGNPCFATLPISLIVFGSMTTAPWLSPLMQKYGRKTGFFFGGYCWSRGGFHICIRPICCLVLNFFDRCLFLWHIHVCAGLL